jgi:hypothetical protein
MKQLPKSFGVCPFLLILVILAPLANNIFAVIPLHAIAATELNFYLKQVS